MKDISGHVKQKLEAIQNDGLNCFISVFAEKALEQAECVEKKSEALSPLAGTVVAVDDNVLIQGELSTAGSKTLHNFKSPFGATIVDKINDAGMIIAGKTNVNEFGIGSQLNTVFKGVAKNPLNNDIASSGAAASVASGLVDISFSVDSNGLPRRLAPESGVCFIKPTYGTVSRFGLVANVSSMDVVGVTAKNACDGFAALSAIAGDDSKDGTTYPSKSYEYKASDNIKGLKIGIPSDFMRATDEESASCINEFATKLESLGATVSSFDFPLADVIPQVCVIISSAESSNNISRFDGVKFGYRTDNFRTINDLIVNSRSEGFEFETKLMDMMGAHVLSEKFYEAYYLKALKIRGLMKQALEDAFNQFDCIIMPNRSAKSDNTDLNDSGFLDFYNDTKLTALANLAGVPAVAMPCGMDKNNMPIGVQLLAKPFGESTLMSVYKCVDKCVDKA